MALQVSGVNPVSRPYPEQQQQQQKRDPLDLLLTGLHVANSVYGIKTNIDRMQNLEDERANMALQKQQIEAQQAGQQTLPQIVQQGWSPVSSDVAQNVPLTQFDVTSRQGGVVTTQPQMFARTSDLSAASAEQRAFDLAKQIASTPEGKAKLEKLNAEIGKIQTEQQLAQSKISGETAASQNKQEELQMNRILRQLKTDPESVGLATKVANFDPATRKTFNDRNELIKAIAEMKAGIASGDFLEAIGQSRYAVAKQNLADIIGRMRTGAAMTEQEIALYNNLLPSLPQIFTNNQDVINSQLSAFESPAFMGQRALGVSPQEINQWFKKADPNYSARSANVYDPYFKRIAPETVQIPGARQQQTAAPSQSSKSPFAPTDFSKIGRQGSVSRQDVINILGE